MQQLASRAAMHRLSAETPLGLSNEVPGDGGRHVRQGNFRVTSMVIMDSAHLSHIAMPFALGGSAVTNAIRDLAREHSSAGGRTSVILSDNRDAEVENADVAQGVVDALLVVATVSGRCGWLETGALRDPLDW